MPFDVAGEVHAKERELGVWHRVDQPGHQMMTLLAQGVILAPEWDDPDADVLAGHGRHFVGIQPGAIDQIFGLKCPLGRLQCHRAGGTGDLLDRGTRKDVSASLVELIGEGGGHLGEVYNPGVGRPQGAHSGSMGFDLFKSFRADDLQVSHAVGRPSLV